MSQADIEAIKQLKARYFRFLDTKKWAAWRALFTDDAIFEGTSRPFAGPDDVRAATSAWLEEAVTVHQGLMPEISLTGPDEATGIWAMQDIVQFRGPIQAGAYRGLTGFVGFGHYEEAYRRLGGGWKISRLRLTRLRIDPLREDMAIFPIPEGLLRSGEGG
jgi:hypothetical protein